MLIYFCIYFNLTFLCNFVYKIKSSTIFSNISISLDVYLLISFCSIILLNKDFDKSSLNILLNFLIFIAFQLRLKQYINFFCNLRFNIVLINK